MKHSKRKNIFMRGWPLLLSLFLALAYLISPTLGFSFYDQLVATLIGVLIAFWLGSLYDYFSQKKQDYDIATRSLVLLKQELYHNKRELGHLEHAINSAVELRVHGELMKAIKEEANSLKDGTFYAVQSSGGFKVIDGDLIASIVSSYQKIHIIQGLVRLIATREGVGPDGGKSQETLAMLEKNYKKIVDKCSGDKSTLSAVIEQIDKRLGEAGIKFHIVEE